jgi:uncharacterized integral membrane protein (TIGR00697 family)
MKTLVKEKEFKGSQLLTLLSMFSITLLITAFILSAKVITIGSHIATAAALVLPAWFLLNDVITEVYGYLFAKRLFWFTMLCLLIFSIMTNGLIYLPSPSNWNGGTSYHFVCAKLLFYYFIGLTGFIVSGLTNIYIISKCKSLLNGRYFWLRSIAASTIGEALYSIITGYIVFSFSYFSPLNNTSLSSTIDLIITVYCIKIFYTICLSWLSALLAAVLKHYEAHDQDTNNIGYNPFKTH